MFQIMILNIELFRTKNLLQASIRNSLSFYSRCYLMLSKQMKYKQKS